VASVTDVAKYIVEKLGTMTTMKLQKLCYYCQSWALAWDEMPLFDEDFQAWAAGPVVPALFDAHRGKFVLDANFFANRTAYDFTENERDTIEKVLAFYGDKEPHWLSELSHQEKPWRDARRRAHAGPGELCNEPIPKEEMQAYYAGLIANA
jgi:uncharacterized phage-associated protein